jgi:hypothetical protein
VGSPNDLSHCANDVRPVPGTVPVTAIDLHRELEMNESSVSLEDVVRRLKELLQWLGTDAKLAVKDAPRFAMFLAGPAQRRATLVLLSLLDPEQTASVIGQVVPLAASDRDALLVRQLLGRLAWHRLRQLVPPVIDTLLDDADDHDYRRYAELLDHLGLFDALEELRARASESCDAGIREVAEEYGG